MYLGRAAVATLSAMVVVCAVLPLSGCPSRGGRGDRPPGHEPTVSLYDHQTGEKRRLKIEEYIAGVVAGEIEPDWPDAAIEAQAILARTFTMKKLKSGGVRRIHGTDVCTDEKHFQAYDASSADDDRIRRAVERTRGQVALYNGCYINAWFHSASGGKTATPREGLGFREEATPYVRPVKDVDTDENVRVWTASFRADELRKAARVLGKRIRGGLRTVVVGRRGPSGRALTIRLNGEPVPAPELRLSLGPKRMRSTLIDAISVDGDQVRMKGRGFGHGVGMSQWGAKCLAERGRSAEDIVRYYFKGVEIKKYW